MRIVKDDLWLCQDCVIYAVNGDLTGVDYYLSGDAAKRRCLDIEAGVERFGANLVPNYDSESGEGIEEFSLKQCDGCRCKLAGSRYSFAILGD